jgi:hypothetical protein
MEVCETVHADKKCEHTEMCLPVDCSERLCFWTMDKVQKPSNSECYTPLSESFRIYQSIVVTETGIADVSD